MLIDRVGVFSVGGVRKLGVMDRIVILIVVIVSHQIVYFIYTYAVSYMSIEAQ